MGFKQTKISPGGMLVSSKSSTARPAQVLLNKFSSLKKLGPCALASIDVATNNAVININISVLGLCIIRFLLEKQP